MKIKITFVSLAFVLIGLFEMPGLFAQPVAFNRWNGNTATTLEKGKWEAGIFQAFRYGIGHSAEINTYALALPLVPHLGLKKTYFQSNGWQVAAEHALSSPTPFLNIVSRKGIGGLLSPEYDFPLMVCIENTLLVSKPISTRYEASARLGAFFTLRGSKPDYQSSMDIPIFYPRMAHYYQGVSIRPSLGIKTELTHNLLAEEELKLYCITRAENAFFFENAGCLMWLSKRSLRVKVGYLLTYGDYPFGKLWKIWPTLDLVFGNN